MCLLPLILPGLCLACAPDYKPFYDGWCMRIKESRNHFDFDSARNQCAAEGTLPAIIRNEEDNAAILRAVIKEGLYYDRFYIGLTCDPEKKQFVWDDGSVANFTNFAEDYKCGSEAFSVVYVNTQKWVRKKARDRVHAVVCMHPRRTNSPCDFYETAATANGSALCVSVVEMKKTWTDASRECALQQAVLGATTDAEINNHILRSAQFGKLDGVHVGLQNIPDLNYTWLSGEEVEFTNFARGFPNEDNFGTCVAMNTLFMAGKWVNVPCDGVQLPYSCTKEPFTGTPSKPAGCPTTEHYSAGDEIFSPGYPSNGTPGTCEYLIIVPKGKIIRLIAEMFEANVCCDKLEIFEGLFGRDVFKSLTGRLEHGHVIYVHSHAVRLVWEATSAKNVRGFHITIDAVDSIGQ